LATLDAKLKQSTGDQGQATDPFSSRTRQAVELLIQSLDRADQACGGELLKEVPEAVLYEAAVTVIMRLVFLVSAEERGLRGDPLYDENYAVSTLVCRNDAWVRLLSTFRAVFGGVHHGRMRISAYPGNLFDPDRFPFLEGRPNGTSWRTHAIDPLPIDDRAVSRLLESVQSVAFRSFEIEQIGHIYERLLDQTVKRATEPMIGLVAAKGSEPVVELSRLELLHQKGAPGLFSFLKKVTGRSHGPLRRARQTPLAGDEERKLKTACGRSRKLFQRVRPFSGLMRNDASGRPLIIHAGRLFVTAGTDRRSAGAHYTPANLTEPIVRHALEPLVYDGPAENKSRGEWKLRSPRELLDLKICDMACGAGAFLVQACRYLSERLVEAWGDAVQQYPGVDSRNAEAPRLVAQRCLYGVDKNPLAVEMAKLSLWLLTLSKDKPFVFLDHCLRSGDSLVGLSSVQQFKRFSLQRNNVERKDHHGPFDEKQIEDRLQAVGQLRKQIEEQPTESPRDLDRKQAMLKCAEEQTHPLTHAADLLLAESWPPTERFKAEAQGQLNGAGIGARFHWPLEFPEVFVGRDGFDAFLGNPPFINAIEGGLSTTYKVWLASRPHHLTGTADFAFHFLAQAHNLTRPAGAVGLLMPRPFLNAQSASQLRRELVDARPPAVLFSPKGSSSFASANVKVVAVVLCTRRGGRCLSGVPGDLREVAIQSQNWWSAISSSAIASQIVQSNVQRLGDVFDVAASMTTENAYQLKAILEDHAKTDWPRLVTTGLIDPGKCLWGQVACRYLKSTYRHPVICPSRQMSADLKRRLVTAARPKMLVAGVAGPGGGIEAFVDEHGLTCGAVSTYTITHPADSIPALQNLCDFLNSAEVAALVFTELYASSMGSGLLTIKKAFLANLSLPALKKARPR
jgi:hypothetical protein